MSEKILRIPVEEKKVIPKFNFPSRYSWVKTDDPEFAEALDWIFNTRRNLFINGPAGVGKSVMIELVYHCLKGNVIVLAPTGISASKLADDGIPAATIHCGLKIPSHAVFSDDTRVDQQTLFILENTDVILIDEVGMVSSSLFDQIGRLIKRAEKNRKTPIRVITFGDILQLPPVVNLNDPLVFSHFQKQYKGNIFFFHSHFYSYRDFVCLNLSKIYRQSSASFQNILNRMRLDIAEPSDFEIVNRQVIPLEEFKKKHPLSLILAPTVSMVSYLNETYGIPNPRNKHITYNAVTVDDFDWKEASLVEPSITIYEGQQVMCIHNAPGVFQNGTLGIAIKVTPEAVCIKKKTGEEVWVERAVFPQYSYKINANGNVEAELKGSCSQIACKPATASTIHKAQGLTLEAVYLYYDPQGTWIPKSGTYLALSRCKTLEGIGLRRPLRPTDISTVWEAFDFLELKMGNKL